jgi:hypothetical protein
MRKRELGNFNRRNAETVTSKWNKAVDLKEAVELKEVI